jgi:N-acetyl-anhydromuramyl-L-alanine amidase AmpD
LDFIMRTHHLAPGILLALCAGCQMSPSRSLRVEPQARGIGDEIVACGGYLHTGAPVVLWTTPPYYDAYPVVPDPKRQEGGSGPALVTPYQPGRVEKSPDGTRRVLIDPDCTDLSLLAGVVDQFVLHFDVCGLSRTCFTVLRDRALSVQFLLDVDGTIYQTLDVREEAYHATQANVRSIGIEIANLGAYPPQDHAILDEWYKSDVAGPYMVIPERLKNGGVRTPGFVARPARRELVRGEIQGQDLVQYDFTPEQYDSLVKLTVALCRAFPKITPDAPRDAAGQVRTEALSDAEYAAFHGILGHYHVQKNKNDPGPAFDWDAFLARVHAGLADGTTPEP